MSAELASIAPFADTLPALHELKNLGFKLGLCSNLALDYAAPIIAALPFALDACVWSFDTGAIKPDPIIYAHACQRLCCAPGDVLMVGDTVEANVEGPRAFGMRALCWIANNPSRLEKHFPHCLSYATDLGAPRKRALNHGATAGR